MGARRNRQPVALVEDERPTPPHGHVAGEAVEGPPAAPSRLVKALEGWKALLGIAVALALAGVAWARWEAGLAHTPDLERDRAAAAVTRAEVEKLRKDIDEQAGDMDWVKRALWAVVQKTGVEGVPPPP